MEAFIILIFASKIVAAAAAAAIALTITASVPSLIRDIRADMEA